jgi:hypothetical protein
MSKRDLLTLSVKPERKMRMAPCVGLVQGLGKVLGLWYGGVEPQFTWRVDTCQKRPVKEQKRPTDTDIPGGPSPTWHPTACSACCGCGG